MRGEVRKNYRKMGRERSNVDGKGKSEGKKEQRDTKKTNWGTAQNLLKCHLLSSFPQRLAGRSLFALTVNHLQVLQACSLVSRGAEVGLDRDVIGTSGWGCARA